MIKYIDLVLGGYEDGSDDVQFSGKRGAVYVYDAGGGGRGALGHWRCLEGAGLAIYSLSRIR